MFVRTWWSPGTNDDCLGILNHAFPQCQRPSTLNPLAFIDDQAIIWRLVTTVEELNRYPRTGTRDVLVVCVEAAADPAVDPLWGIGVAGRILFVPQADVRRLVIQFPRAVRPDGTITEAFVRLRLHAAHRELAWRRGFGRAR